MALFTSSHEHEYQASKRVVSLDPTVTEWLVSFGVAELLVGRSHLCNGPAYVQSLVPVTYTRGIGSSDEAPEERPQHRPRDVHALDLAALVALKPNLVILPHRKSDINLSAADLDGIVEGASHFSTFRLEGRTFKSILDGVLRLSRMLGRMPEGMAFIAEQEGGLKLLQQKIMEAANASPGDTPARPRVVCVDRLEPLTVRGDWVPDIIWLAGAETLDARGGGSPMQISWDELRAYDPDVIIIIPEGRPIDEVRPELPLLFDDEKGAGLKAVTAERVYVMDGRSCLDSPGPGLYRAVHLAASAIHGLPLEASGPGNEIRRIRRSRKL